MKPFIRNCVAAAMLAGTVLAPAVMAQSAGSISTPEEHVLRGFFDRQSAAIPADKLALTKGSTPEVRAFAQSELDMYQKLGDGMAKLYDQFKLANRDNPTQEYRPLAEGQSRGVTSLGPKDTWTKVGVLETLQDNSGKVTGYGAGGYSIEDLKKLDGVAFDKQYFLLVFYGQQAMLRHATDELLFDQRNPAMEAYARDAIKLISAQAKKADDLYRGQAGGMAAGGAGGMAAGGAPGGMAAGGAPGAAPAGAPAK
ncbi:MAG: hypothetical protein QM808_15365 [Steroidobacteraceae bacterium]